MAAERPRWRRAGGKLLAMSGAILLAACGSTGELGSSARLVEMLDPPAPSDTPGTCDVGAEIRPALGCVRVVPIRRSPLPAGTSGDVEVSLALPESLRSARAVVEMRLVGALGEKLAAPIAVAVAEGTPSLRSTLAIPPGTPAKQRIAWSAVGIALPLAVQRFATTPIDVAPGSELTVGLGFEPIVSRAGAAPVEFVVAVETSAGSFELLRETLDPAAAPPAWADRRISLRAMAGERARFTFETRVVPRDGEPAGDAFSAPLWGSPMVLSRTPRAGARNVILVSLDTLRGDFVGGMLEGRRLTPEIDRIAERGTSFLRASAAFPSTTASHASLLSGVYPAVHGVGVGQSEFDPRLPTLAGILAARGYVTSAVTENAMLFARAFAPGFDFYREEKGLNVWDTRGDIETTFAAGLEWIEGHPRERFFLFLHTYQVHSPYLPPPEYDLWKTWTHDGAESPIDGTTPVYVRDRALYAGEVRYTDAMVGRLFAELERLGVLRDTIVVVTSDHGEEFAEHGGREHARTVYEELLHVPLVVVAPGLVPAGLTSEEPVSLVDVVPTLLALAGIAAPPDVQGRSLAGLMRGDPFPSDRVLFAENGPLSDTRRLVAARKGSMKWIFRSDRAGKPEIYDLAADPHEQHSLASPDLVAAGRPLFAAHGEMRERARRWRASDDEAGPVPANVDDQVKGKLRALGYLD